MTSQVTNDATIRIVLVFMVIFDWASYLNDMNGAFLMVEFENEEELYMKFLEWFEKK